ncbi:hypothetical protein [Asanoa iriomotensis]|uniref:Uncharacterized protein n=1 Tax=Asanoa iriomotensis TaxID=234613 RepID=A0ABQ4C1V2_9ACTN|nr:hypothetical protein [Asanoa iriomotensis]GIF56762.1 hypothetical protein Air01nite_28570 [Asanoa iriomotensis]
MGLAHRVAWCQWRRRETLRGIVRADLRLLASTDGGRRTPVPGPGIVRPLRDLGGRTAAGDPDLRVAVIWVENAPELVPGTTERIRLAPLDPSPWLRLAPHDVITMREGRPVVGVATVLEVTRPRAD